MEKTIVVMDPMREDVVSIETSSFMNEKVWKMLR